jgi:quinol monooxygenase YgiN
MSVTRINEFRARDGKADELRGFLASVVSGMAALAGCQSSQLLQSHDDPIHFVVLEVWDSIEAHQASAKNISPASLARVTELLDGSPRGEYFHG